MMKLNKKYFLAVLSLLGFQIAFGMSPTLAAMDSKDWADLFEIADTVLNGGSSSQANQNSTNYSGKPCVSEWASYCAIDNSTMIQCSSREKMERKVQTNIGGGYDPSLLREEIRKYERMLTMNEDDLGPSARAFTKYNLCTAKASLELSTK